MFPSFLNRRLEDEGLEGKPAWPQCLWDEDDSGDGLMPREEGKKCAWFTGCPQRVSCGGKM